MGMYNEVVYTCPECGEEIVDQTKSGDCTLTSHPQYQVPVEGVAGLDKEVYCGNCNTAFSVVGCTHVQLHLVPS